MSRAAATTCFRTISSWSPTGHSTSSSTSSRTSRASRRCCSSSSRRISQGVVVPVGYRDLGAPARGGRADVPRDEEPVRGQLEPPGVPASARLRAPALGSSSRSGRSRRRPRPRVLFGLAVLAPALRDRYHLSLTQVGVMLGVSGVGAVLTLLPWGVAADHVGERVTGAVGLLGAERGAGSVGVRARFRRCWSCCSRSRARSGRASTRRPAARSRAGSRARRAASRWASARPRSRSAGSWRPSASR